MALEEIKEKFVGVWKLDRSENFQEFLQEVGKSKISRFIEKLQDFNMNGYVGVTSRRFTWHFIFCHKY